MFPNNSVKQRASVPVQLRQLRHDAASGSASHFRAWTTLSLLVLACIQKSSACDPRRYCPTNCTVPGAVGSSAGVAILDGHLTLLGSVGKAVDVMRQFPGVLTDDHLFVHTTIQVGSQQPEGWARRVCVCLALSARGTDFPA